MLLSFLSGSGQTRAQKIYDHYSREAGITCISFTKSLIDAMNLDLDDDGKKITGDFQECRVMMYDAEKGKLANFAEQLSKEFGSLRYEEIHPKGQKPDDDVRFWIEGKGKTVTECHIVIGNKHSDKNSSLVISFFGNFKVEDLHKLEKIGEKQAE